MSVLSLELPEISIKSLSSGKVECRNMEKCRDIDGVIFGEDKVILFKIICEDGVYMVYIPQDDLWDKHE